MKSFALNLLIAVIWLLLSTEPSAEAFGIGFLLGFAMLAVFRSVLDSAGYVRRVLAIGRFFLVFTWEFLVANANVVWTILFRANETLQPNFITYDVTGLTSFEILLLSYCISLTPGSTTVQVSEDFQTLVLHTLDAQDAAAARARIDQVLKRGILSFTR